MLTALTTAWEGMTHSKVLQNLKKRSGMESYYRTTEVTYNRITEEWHWHFHVLIFFTSGTTADTAEHAEKFLEKWIYAANHYAHVEAKRSAQDYSITRGRDALHQATYVTKSRPDLRSGEADTWYVGDFLYGAAHGDEEAIELWSEYDRAVLGFRIESSSQNLKKPRGAYKKSKPKKSPTFVSEG
jgi:hypothetical protein